MCPAKLYHTKHLPSTHQILIDVWLSRKLGDTNLKARDYGLSRAHWHKAGVGDQEGVLAKLAPSARCCNLQSRIDISKATE